MQHDLSELIDMKASKIGRLTNPTKLANTFKIVKHSDITDDSVGKLIGYLEYAFLIERAVRYGIKGKQYIDTPSKYSIKKLSCNFKYSQKRLARH